MKRAKSQATAMLQFVNVTKILAIVLMAGVVCLNLAAVPAAIAKPAAPKPAAVKPTPAKPADSKQISSVYKTVANPHLHKAKVAVAKSTKTKEHRHWRHRWWWRRWSFTDWAVVHRGTGTVMGQVVGGSSSSSPGEIQVALRKPNGGVFRNTSLRHLVHTGPGGTFVMRHVRIGSYRVRASKGKAAGHANIHLHGGTAVVSIKI